MSIALAMRAFDRSLLVVGLTLLVANDEIELTLADVEFDDSAICADLDLALARLALAA